MSLATLIRSMAAAGASPEAIALAVEAVEYAESKIEASRAKARERKARQRERDSHADVTGRSRDSAGQERDTPASPSFLPPRPPNQTTPTPPDITTRARGPGNSGPSKTDFAAWWAVYPRKTDKLKAETAFAKAWGRVEPPDKLKTLVEAATAYAQRVDPGFVKHPATWLNAGSWMDEEPPNNLISLDEIHGRQPAPSAKFLARQANLARSLAGSEIAAGRRRDG
jgi:hypothetical protein